MSHIGVDELITYTDQKGGIYSGGFSLNNILKKMGESPIITLNTNQTGGNGEKVSDLFKDLAIPIHALSYKIGGLSNNQHDPDYSNYNSDNESEESDNESDYNSDTVTPQQDGGNIISDDLYNKLLGLVSVDINGNEIQEKKMKKQSKRLLKSKNKNKKTRKHTKNIK